MDIQVGAEADIATPAAGYRTLFINTDKGNKLYYKLSDGSFEVFSGAGEELEDIASSWMSAAKCALDKGFITASQFQDIMNTGITVTETNYTDADGNTTNSISVGSRTITLISITLDSSAFSLATGATHQIVTTFDPTNVGNQSLSYITSNSAKATVNATGLITSATGSTGSAVITVIPNIDPSKSKTVTISSP